MKTHDLKTGVELFPRATIRKRVPVPLNIGRADLFTFRNLVDGGEHLVMGLGPWESQEFPNVRVHSECLTGDVFGSERCDCGDQLHESMETFQEVGGLIVYLRQEGRGIGLYAKLDAYELQLKGLDTYDANKALGFDADQRNYTVAAQMLQAIGVSKIKLVTNNPDKRAQLEHLGLTVVQQYATGVFLKPGNADYLHAKVFKTGHTIDVLGDVIGAVRSEVKGGNFKCGS